MNSNVTIRLIVNFQRLVTTLHRRVPDEEIVSRITRWLDDAVIGLKLCPFAKAPRQRDEIRFIVSNAQNDETLLSDLSNECLHLAGHASTETTLLIVANYLEIFDDFNQFLALADGLIEQMNWSGEFQIASFHPHYQFASSTYDDRENWTNRAPFPVLHLLREASLSKAIDSYPFVDQIPLNNIKRLNELDDPAMKRIFLDSKQNSDE